MKTILLTNDDGITSPGLKVLQEALSGLGQIVTIAPDKDNSAVSHSLTMHRPIKINKLADEVYSLDGTPTDCVAIGLKKILNSPPDLLVSGINAGANLGDDISYSGTVSAAIEATMYSIPSMALSIGGTTPYNYIPAMDIARKMTKKLLKESLPKETLLNINIPNGVEILGVRVTRQGRKLWEDTIHETFDPKGNRHYWIGGGTPLNDSEKDTDVQAFSNGFISVTPIQLDLTNHQGIGFLKEDLRLEEI